MSDDLQNGAGTRQARLYPAGAPARDAERPKLGICLSGGGSRALSCALGQLSGLRSLEDPSKPKKSLLDRVDYLSSVSGGSWAAVVFTYLPETIDGHLLSDDDLLISPQQPGALVKANEQRAVAANVAFMNPYCLGTAPQRFDFGTIARLLHTLYEWGLFADSSKWPWFWIAAVGEIILKPFGLYQAHYRRTRSYLEPSHFFSLSTEHVAACITPGNPSLTPAQFYTARDGRAPLFVNTNLLQDATTADPPQTPVQAGSIASGILGRSPDGAIVGGGSVESFAFTSILQGPGESGDAAVSLKRRFSLCDIAGCSSAFFAEFLLQYLNAEIDKISGEIERFAENTLHLPTIVARKLAARVRAGVEKFLDADVSKLIPRYNYWPLETEAGGTSSNAVHGFSDGGNFDNTGILGLLARTDANRLVAFVNSENPLRLDPTSGQVIVSGQLALLFGYRSDPVAGEYVSFGGMDPAEPMSFVQVFQDEGAFAALRQGLYQASCGGPGAQGPLGTATAAFSQTLTTAENPVAHIRGGRVVTVLWVYNNRVNRWQDAIDDAAILEDLKLGQSNQRADGTPIDARGHGQGPLANFPWFSTAAQIHLDKEGVNMLAQLSAWNVRELESELKQLIAP